jgi:5-hydroxyisourate hydrolase
MPGRLTTHVLDTMHGCPAAGVKLELWSLSGAGRAIVASTRTNADGRAEPPLLAADTMKAGDYELVFFVGDYFAAKAVALPNPRFLDQVPVRFAIADPGANYHVPLLCSPWAYTTYRGS